MKSTLSNDLRSGALVYHRQPRPGKLEIQRDQAARQPARPGARLFARRRRRLRGDRRRSRPTAAELHRARQPRRRRSPTAPPCSASATSARWPSKPVMEGKAVLFKKFAGIDVFDIEIDEQNVDKLVDVIAALEPTFGGINLEDIKAPECFEIEEQLRERMKIPVFHDDQHGTAIIVGAAVLNGARARRQEDRRGQDRRLRRRRGGARLPQPAGRAGRAAREHLGHRHRRRGLRGPQRR